MSRLAVIFAAALVLAHPVAAHHPDSIETDTTGWVVARVPIADPADLETLRADHQVWSYIWRLGYAVIHTPPDRLPAGALIDQDATDRLTPDTLKSLPSALGGSIPGFSCYRTVEQTYADLNALAVAQPEIAEWVDYGDSWLKSEGAGGYDLNALVLTNRSIAGPKPILMVMAAMHARELTTAETATRFAEFLAAGYGVDPDITWVLDHNEVHILPQQNPDGRKQAETGLFWRKNVNDNFCAGDPNSRGADLNRNSSTLFFGGPASSGNQCSETYRGPAAASEPETSAVESYLASRFPDQRDGDIGIGAPMDAQGIFISLHSAGEYVFYPWEGDDIDTGNEAGYQALSQRLAFLTGYSACQNCCIGTASGTTVDYAYEELGVASLTFELGTSFFQACASFENTIWPVNREALLYAAKAARRPYLSSFGPEAVDLQAVLNGDGSAMLTASLESGRYVVNNPCPPADATVTSQSIAQVRYTVNTPPWAVAGTAMSADDGTFDQNSEMASATISANQFVSGRNIVFVQAEDMTGALGPPRAVFVVVNSLFADGFE